MINFRRRVFLSFVAIFSCGAVALIIASVSTDYWVQANPVRNVDSATKLASQLKNTSDSKFTGTIHLGLFHGLKILDYGLGSQGRETHIWVNLDLGKSQPFNSGLWIGCLLCLCISVGFALLSIGFAILNVSRKPVETISGPLGLYLWNILAVVAQTTGIILFVVLYFDYFNKSMLTASEEESNWTSKDKAYIGYSFYISMSAIFVYLLNMMLVCCSGTRVPVVKKKKPDETVGMDRAFMY